MASYLPNQLYQVPLAELQPDPAQPRKYMDPVALDEMTASVGQVGTGPGGGGLDRNRMVLSIIIRVAACVGILRRLTRLTIHQT